MTTTAVALEHPRAAVVHARLTRWAIHVPGDGDGDGDAAAVGPADAHELLGRKGLLYKEPATRLALCAVHRALGREPRAPRLTGPPDPHTAVVVASNLGNVETVARVARAVRSSSVKQVSVLDAPNASSNVIASTVAIWFRFGGPNLTVCSGATAGLDALRLGALLLAAGRAERVVVVGAEPDDPLSQELRRGRGLPGPARPARAAAAALVLEPARNGAPLLGPVRAAARAEELREPRATLCIGPAGRNGDGVPTLDLEAELGDLYGALGVVQAATATALAGEHATIALLCGDERDGWRAATVTAGGEVDW